MSHRTSLKITTRDKVLRAWQNSTELVRDFEVYSKEISDDKDTADLFAQYAVDEGVHAATLLNILHSYDDMQG